MNRRRDQPHGEAHALSRLAPLLERRPLLVALAGPNGAGKSTFYDSHLEQTGLRFLNADEISRELRMDPYESAGVINHLRKQLVQHGESFILETVFSDPVGDKLTFLKEAVTLGHTVVLVFIGISGPDQSEQRVAMRVSQGGHDVPPAKLLARFPRTLANLKAAVVELPAVFIFDNDDLRHPYRIVSVFEQGRQVWHSNDQPEWLTKLLD